MTNEEKNNEQGTRGHDTKTTKTRPTRPSEGGETRLGVHIMLAILACSLWWINGTQLGYIVFPLIILSLIAMAFTMKFFKTSVYKYSASFVLYLFLSPFLLSGLSFALTSTFSSTITYSIVYEFQTPTGKRIVANKITVNNGDSPIASLRSFYNGQTSVKADSNVVMLTNDKGIIPLLSPNKTWTFSFLKTMPDWIKSPHRSLKTKEGIQGYLLTDKNTPSIICMPSPGTPESYSLASKGSLKHTFGQGYAFIQAWVSFDNVDRLCNLNDTVKWWNYDKKKPQKGYLPFGRLGVTSNQISIDEHNTASFLRI